MALVVLAEQQALLPVEVGLPLLHLVAQQRLLEQLLLQPQRHGHGRGIDGSEREVLVLTCKGLVSVEVGSALGIKRKTAETLLMRARRRLGMRTIELAVLAAKAEWV